MTPALLAAPPGAAPVGLPPELLARIRASIVRVQAARGGAAGVVWGAGAVVTNYHVVAGAGPGLRVVSADGDVAAARVRDASRRLDLALLAVEGGDGLPPAPIGRSARLRVGELVFAIGHPWGEPWAVTAGVVSALGGTPGSGRGTAAVIRSDVRLAPGNSGGPLVDARGQVVGVNAMVVGGDLALAIPSDVVRSWLERAR